MPQPRVTRSRVIAVGLLMVGLLSWNSYSPTVAVPSVVVNRETGEAVSVYDYIVVGGGQSGLVLGNRLSEDGKSSVLVVEYGHLYHDDPKIARPWQPFDAPNGVYHDPKLMYNITTTPQAALNNRPTKQEAAATVGGGSSVNGMFMNRGSSWDYDAWERLGNPGWGWDGLLPYFKKSATFTPPGQMLREEYNATYDTEAAYGGNGPIHLSNPAWAWPGQKNQIAGWKELGVKQSHEGAGGNATGVFWVPRAQDPATQTRSYSVNGHLDAALKRKGFHLVTGHSVERVLLSNEKRAIGVEIKARDRQAVRQIQAKKEVVLCAGGVHTPVILQRSGIGPKHILERAGIQVLHELPGVGMNFQDHPAGGLGHSYETDLPLNPSNLTANLTFQASMHEAFVNNRTGPYIGGHNAVAFLTGQDILSQNATSLSYRISSQNVEHYLPADYLGDETLLTGYLAQRKLLKEAFTSPDAALLEIPLAGDAYILLILQKPLSRGTITLDPTDPFGPPLIDSQTLRNPLDLELMVASARLAREWTSTPSMSVLGPLENWPGRDKESDVELMDHFRGMMESGIGHQSGTAAMLPLDMGGVVDTELKVYGIEGLSVADASMIPFIPSCNLCATVYAVAEKASDLIKKRHSSRFQKQY